MKRIGNLFQEITKIENIELAEKKAIRGKRNTYGVIKHLRNRDDNLYNIQQILLRGESQTSDYTHTKIFEPKERIISKLPFYPDRIIHHSITNILEPIFYSVFISTTYSCIKGRGVHKASYDLRDYLRNEKETRYCLKLDIRKFFESVDNKILKRLLRRKFKDRRLLELLDEIIDSNVGLPLGNITSQFLANYYLTYFDHWIKEVLKIKYYQRYTDDIVILSNSKEELWNWFYRIKEYLNDKLNLEVKGNYQVFPVSKRGIDWVGYKHFHTHTLIRKSIKNKYIKNKNKINHKGWIIHAHSYNLRKKYERA